MVTYYCFFYLSIVFSTLVLFYSRSIKIRRKKKTTTTKTNKHRKKQQQKTFGDDTK